MTNGELFYNAWREHFCSGDPARAWPVRWQEVTPESRRSYEHAAEVLVKALPPKEVMPAVYVDALPAAMTFEEDLKTKSIRITMELNVPQVTALNARPGSTENILEEIKEGFSKMDRKIRISTVTDSEIQSELNRLNRDGTIREFAENEGSW